MSNDVHRLLDPVGFTSSSGKPYITWYGEKLCQFGREDEVEILARVMYSFGYVLGEVSEIEQPATNVGAPHPLWHELQMDRRLLATWDGWSVDAASPGRLRFPGQPTISASSDSTKILPDGTISVPVPAVSARRQPDWLHIHHGDISVIDASVRVYVNTSPDHARDLAENISVHLLDCGLDQFSMKFLMGSDHDLRADSSVIYLPSSKSASAAVRMAIEMAAAYVAYPHTPLLTLKVADGLALAQSPLSGESFGLTRCREIANAFISARRQGRRLDVSADLPFNAASPWDLTETPLVLPKIDPLPGSTSSTACAHTKLDQYARTLSLAAIRADGRATWLFRGLGSSRVEASGSDVYRGSAGPLLVLAYATRLLGGDRYRRLLRATARDMLIRVKGQKFNGFHVGPAGSAAALAEAAVISQDSEVRDMAISCSAAVVHGGEVSDQWDVINGIAGQMIGAKLAADLLKEPMPDLAVSTSTLASLAKQDRELCYAKWPSSVGRGGLALAGLAHGGSGAALGLAAGSSDASALPSLALNAIRFEDEQRCSGDQWLDYRLPNKPEGSVTWCNGAVGIGLATAALATRFGNHELWARVGRAVRRCDADPLRLRRDSGLCHGTSGLALAQFVLGRLTGDEVSVEKSRALVQMPMPKNNDYSLFTGLSGIMLAHLTIEGLARPPAAFVLDYAVWKAFVPFFD